jgi:hypothetical protein
MDIIDTYLGQRELPKKITLGSISIDTEEGVISFNNSGTLISGYGITTGTLAVNGYSHLNGPVTAGSSVSFNNYLTSDTIGSMRTDVDVQRDLLNQHTRQITDLQAELEELTRMISDLRGTDGSDRQIS